MSLTNKDKRRLRSIGHKLKPVVSIGSKGLTDTVSAEIDRALGDHELIKVSIKVADRSLLQSTTEDIVQSCRATLIQAVGHVALLYRPTEKPDPRLSNVLRWQTDRD